VERVRTIEEVIEEVLSRLGLLRKPTRVKEEEARSWREEEARALQPQPPPEEARDVTEEKKEEARRIEEERREELHPILRPGTPTVLDFDLKQIGKRYQFYREHSTCAWARVWYEGKPPPYIQLLHILTYYEYAPETGGYRFRWRTAVIATLQFAKDWGGIAEYYGYVTPQGWMGARKQIESWISLFQLENQYHRQQRGLDKYTNIHDGLTLGVDGTTLQPIRIHPYPSITDRFDVGGCAKETKPEERRECCVQTALGNFIPCSPHGEVVETLRRTGCYADFCLQEWCRA
jgi:hypothetical protein